MQTVTVCSPQIGTSHLAHLTVVFLFFLFGQYTHLTLFWLGIGRGLASGSSPKWFRIFNFSSGLIVLDATLAVMCFLISSMPKLFKNFRPTTALSCHHAPLCFLVMKYYAKKRNANGRMWAARSLLEHCLGNSALAVTLIFKTQQYFYYIILMNGCAARQKYTCQQWIVLK